VAPAVVEPKEPHGAIRRHPWPLELKAAEKKQAARAEAVESVIAELRTREAEKVVEAESSAGKQKALEQELIRRWGSTIQASTVEEEARHPTAAVELDLGAGGGKGGGPPCGSGRARFGRCSRGTARFVGGRGGEQVEVAWWRALLAWCSTYLARWLRCAGALMVAGGAKGGESGGGRGSREKEEVSGRGCGS